MVGDIGVHRFGVTLVEVEGCRGTTSWCNLGYTRMFLLPFLRHISPIGKIYGLLELIIICTFILLRKHFVAFCGDGNHKVGMQKHKH